MTRALCFSLAILASFVGAGCHEEPTIVIKFEPNDAAAKPADLARGADLGRPADLAAAKPTAAAGDKKRECKTAADCVLEPSDCCDCANGGQQHAVAKKNLAKLEAERHKRCKTAVCTMMFSTDPSCGQKAECVDGACAMVAKKPGPPIILPPRK
jgi:hypothetical protein